MTTTALVRVEPQGIIPRTVDEATALAKHLSEATSIPMHMRGNAADVLAMTLAGAELGLPPMASIRGLYVQEGKPAMFVQTKLAIVRRSGLLAKFNIIESTDDRCTVEMQRVGEEPFRVSFGRPEAEKAKLLKEGSQYMKQPRKMYRWRAIGEGLDLHFPDVLLGIDDETTDAYEPQGFTAPAPVVAASVVATAAVEGDAAKKAEKKKAEKAKNGSTATNTIAVAKTDAGDTYDTGTGEILDAEVVEKPKTPPVSPEQKEAAGINPVAPVAARTTPTTPTTPDADDDGFGGDGAPSEVAGMKKDLAACKTIEDLKTTRGKYGEWSKTAAAAPYLEDLKAEYALTKSDIESGKRK